MKYILAIIFILGYIFFVVAIFTSKVCISHDFALLGLLTTLYCPFAVAVYRFGKYIDRGW